MDTTHRTPRTLRAAPLAAALALGALQAPAPQAAEPGAVSAGAPPASEAKSKKTGKRKPREIVVVGSRAKPQQNASRGPSRLKSPKAGTGAPVFGTTVGNKPPGHHVPRVPYFTQLGPTPVAKVPMKWVSCGPNCIEWKLATSHGNLKMKGKVGMSCSAGVALTDLRYQPHWAQQQTVVFQGPPNGNTSGYSKTLWLKPFRAADLEKACQEALKNYAGSNAPVVKKIVKTDVHVSGRCADSMTVYSRTYPVTLRLQCVPPPTPG